MTSRRPLEKRVEKQCVEYAAHFHWINIKLDKAKRGWPDQLFIGPGAETLFVEFKREGERPRKQQIGNHQKLAARNHHVKVVDTFEQFVALLAEYGYTR